MSELSWIVGYVLGVTEFMLEHTTLAYFYFQVRLKSLLSLWAYSPSFHHHQFLGGGQVLQVTEKALDHHSDRAQMCLGLLPFTGSWGLSGHIPPGKEEWDHRPEGRSGYWQKGQNRRSLASAGKFVSSASVGAWRTRPNGEGEFREIGLGEKLSICFPLSVYCLPFFWRICFSALSVLPGLYEDHWVSARMPET